MAFNLQRRKLLCADCSEDCFWAVLSVVVFADADVARVVAKDVATGVTGVPAGAKE